MRRTLCLGLCGTVLMGALVSAEENWARFRGPDGRGVADAGKVPVEFGKETLAWSAVLPGPGSSSAAVWGEAVFVTGEQRKKGEVTLVCLDAGSGKERWARMVHTGDYQTHNMNNAAAATPCLGEDVVVMSWYDSKRDCEMLSAWTHGGEERWKFEVGPFKGQHGTNLQAVIAEGRVLFAYLHQDGGYVAALDAKSGEPLWKTDYPEHSEKTTYITPLVREVWGSGGRRKEVVVVSTSIGVRGLDLQSGAENWALPKEFKERNIVSPVDILAGSGKEDSLLTVGCKNGVFFAVRPPDAAKDGKATVAWRLAKDAPYVPTPVSDGKTLYVLADGGILTAVEALTGKPQWREKLQANFYASPLLIGGKLYCQSREGEMYVAEVGGKFKLLSSADLKPGDEVSWADATPAVGNGGMYVRLGARLDCYRGR